MKTITLRDIPPELADKIESQAKRNGTSLNRTVIQMLRSSEEPSQIGSRTYHELDHLIGSMSAEEAEELNKAILEQRPIEEDMWN